jgi:hypothetical protein
MAEEERGFTGNWEPGIQPETMLGSLLGVGFLA